MPSPLSTCSHCRAPLLAGETVHTDGDRVFCCTGCLSARRVIDGLGLGRFDSLGGAPGPVQLVEVDDGEQAALAELVAAARDRAGAGPCRLEVDVDGVSCASCAWLVEKVAGQVEGVGSATLNPARGTLELAVAPGFEPTRLAQALATVGHRVHPPGSGDADGRARGDDLLFRLGVTALLAMTSMIASLRSCSTAAGIGRCWSSCGTGCSGAPISASMAPTIHSMRSRSSSSWPPSDSFATPVGQLRRRFCAAAGSSSAIVLQRSSRLRARAGIGFVSQ